MNEQARTSGAGTELPANVPSGFFAPSSRPGSLGLLGYYEMLQILGQGRFGIVFRAFDKKLYRMVAVRVPAAELASSDDGRQRFVRAVQAAVSLRHAHIVDVYDVVEDGPIPYLVMEFVDGQTLQQKVAAAGPLPLKDILRIGRQIADALAAAHQQSTVHGDLKPGNVLLAGGNENVRIGDFGLVRLLDRNDAPVLDHDVDLFGLGSIMYMMAAGQPPLGADGSLLRRDGGDVPRPIREVNSDVPPWLADVIGKLHSRNSAERFQSAQEVAAELTRRLVQMDPASVALPSNVPEPPPLSPSSSIAVPSSPGPKRTERSRRALVLAAAAAVLIGGLTVSETLGFTQFTRAVIGVFAAKGPAETDDSSKRGQQVAAGPETTDSNARPSGPKKGKSPPVPAEAPSGPAQIELFNGKDLAGWKVIGHKGWSAKDGVLIGDSGKEQAGFLMSEGEFADYDLELEFKLTKGSDSGVLVRVSPAGAAGNEPVRVQLGDNQATDMPADRKHGALVNVVAPQLAVEPTVGAWQSLRVRVDDDRVQAFLAGQRVVDVNVKNLSSKGAIGLQVDTGHTEFRNVRLVHDKLDPAPARSPLQGAESILTLGGKVILRVGDQERTINAVKDLPAPPFQVIGVRLDGTSINDRDMARLAHLPDLEQIWLRDTKVTDAGLTHLQRLTQLHTLDLHHTDIRDAGLKSLARLTNLRSLDCGSTDIHDAGLAHLQGLTKLETLALDDTHITGAGLQHLAGLTKLQLLDLHKNDIGDKGISHLGKLKGLRSINLDETEVGDAGLKNFETLSNLTSLKVCDTNVKQNGVQRLSRALPKCKIEWDDGTVGPATGK